MSSRSLLPEEEPVVVVHSDTEEQHSEIPIVATQDPALIRRWAGRRSAEPATGEASGSGPATIDVRDGDAGIRFNFPAAGRYRPITWDEWFANFSQHELIFVYERDDADGTPSPRYRLVKLESLKNKVSEDGR